MKRNYTIVTNTMTFLSLMNVVIVGITWRKFLALKTWQKIGVGSAVFAGTHWLGTASIKKESEQLNDRLISKYSLVLKEMKFEDSNIP